VIAAAVTKAITNATGSRTFRGRLLMEITCSDAISPQQGAAWWAAGPCHARAILTESEHCQHPIVVTRK
jgi:hypothetical protein